jgi:hypothetical protein
LDASEFLPEAHKGNLPTFSTVAHSPIILIIVQSSIGDTFP